MTLYSIAGLMKDLTGSQHFDTVGRVSSLLLVLLHGDLV